MFAVNSVVNTYKYIYTHTQIGREYKTMGFLIYLEYKTMSALMELV